MFSLVKDHLSNRTDLRYDESVKGAYFCFSVELLKQYMFSFALLRGLEVFTFGVSEIDINKYKCYSYTRKVLFSTRGNT